MDSWKHINMQLGSLCCGCERRCKWWIFHQKYMKRNKNKMQLPNTKYYKILGLGGWYEHIDRRNSITRHTRNNNLLDFQPTQLHLLYFASHINPSFPSLLLFAIFYFIFLFPLIRCFPWWWGRVWEAHVRCMWTIPTSSFFFCFFFFFK